MTCPSLETMAAWVLDELPEPEAEQFEEHYFGCARCFAQAKRLHELKAQLETSLPAILTNQRHAQLGPLPAVHVNPGESGTLRLDSACRMAVWVLHSPLSDVSRVDFEAHDSTGKLLLAMPDVPFDAERGQVLLACQLHYRALDMGAVLHVHLSGVTSSGKKPLGEYFLEHEFESV